MMVEMLLLVLLMLMLLLLVHDQIIEPGVLEGIMSADSQLWANLEHPL